MTAWGSSLQDLTTTSNTSNPVAILLDFQATISCCTFEHPNSTATTLRKTLFLLEAFGERQERGIRPYCFDYSWLPRSIVAFEEAIYHPTTVSNKVEYLPVIAPTNIIGWSRWSYPPLPWVSLLPLMTAKTIISLSIAATYYHFESKTPYIWKL